MQTNIFLEHLCVELMLDEGGGPELSAQAREQAAQLALVGCHGLQASGFFEPYFGNPVEWEALR